MPSFAQRAAKVASKQPDQPEEEVEMFANGVAFDVVKGWLGTEGKDLQFAEWFGVDASKMGDVLPQRGNFPPSAMITKEAMFVNL